MKGVLFVSEPGPDPHETFQQSSGEPAAAAAAHVKNPECARACLGTQLELGTAHLTHVSIFFPSPSFTFFPINA